MEPTRIEVLQQMIESAPDNAFGRYALALELARAGQAGPALEQFEYLLKHQPDYAAAYQQAGMLLAQQGRTEEARNVFMKGAEVHRRQGNLHALNEIEAALTSLDEESS